MQSQSVFGAGPVIRVFEKHHYFSNYALQKLHTSVSDKRLK